MILYRESHTQQILLYLSKLIDSKKQNLFITFQRDILNNSLIYLRCFRNCFNYLSAIPFMKQLSNIEIIKFAENLIPVRDWTLLLHVIIRLYYRLCTLVVAKKGTSIWHSCKQYSWTRSAKLWQTQPMNLPYWNTLLPRTHFQTLLSLIRVHLPSVLCLSGFARNFTYFKLILLKERKLKRCCQLITVKQ